MRNQVKLFIFLLIFQLTSCLEEMPQPAVSDVSGYLTVQEQQLIKSSNEFSFELLRLLYQQDSTGNLFYSSIGIGNGIGMALNVIGDKPREELKNFLGITGVEDNQINRAYYKLSGLIGNIDRSIRFSGGNSFWINNRYTINQLIGDKLMAYYSAQVELLNFSSENAVRTINKWASLSTGGDMNIVIRDLNLNDRSYIINTMHVDLTGALHTETVMLPEYRFLLPGGVGVNADLLRLKTDSTGYYSDDQVTLIDLPLGSGKFHLLILFPDRPGLLGSLIERINPGIIDQLRSKELNDNYEIFIPKLNLDKEVRLKNIFPESGISEPIVTLKYYFEEHEIFISDFIQKSSISLGLPENQTMTNTGIANYKIDGKSIVIDRPFLFLISEEFTGGILFSGLVTNPGEE